MMILNSDSRAKRSGLSDAKAFTVVEMMVAVTITTVITLALSAVFGQVQKAFRAGIQQVDVYEAGRATSDMTVKDLESMVALGSIDFTNFWTVPFQPGMYNSLGSLSEGAGFQTIQQEFLVFQEYNNVIKAVGYRLIPDRRNGAIDYSQAEDFIRVSRLYRFEAPVSRTALERSPNLVWESIVNAFLRDPSAEIRDAETASVAYQFQEITDGVVHFRATPFHLSGRVWDKNLEDYYYANRDVNLPRDVEVDSTSPRAGPAFSYAFSGDALPSFVEFELGIMEPAIIDEWRSIAEANMQGASEFIRDQAARVQIFRRRLTLGGLL